MQKKKKKKKVKYQIYPKAISESIDIYIIKMWSCPGNMPKYYPGLRDILPDHINIIIILSV